LGHKRWPRGNLETVIQSLDPALLVFSEASDVRDRYALYEVRLKFRPCASRDLGPHGMSSTRKRGSTTGLGVLRFFCQAHLLASSHPLRGALVHSPRPPEESFWGRKVQPPSHQKGERSNHVRAWSSHQLCAFPLHDERRPWSPSVCRRRACSFRAQILRKLQRSPFALICQELGFRKVSPSSHLHGVSA